MKNITNSQIAFVAGAAFTQERLEPFGANWSSMEELFACLQAKKLISSKWKKNIPEKLEERIKFLVSKRLRNKMSSDMKDQKFVLVPKGEYRTIKKSFDKGTNAGGNGVYVEWEGEKAFIVKDSVKHESTMGFPYSSGYKKYPLKTNAAGAVLVSTRHYK